MLGFFEERPRPLLLVITEYELRSGRVHLGRVTITERPGHSCHRRLSKDALIDTGRVHSAFVVTQSTDFAFGRSPMDEQKEKLLRSRLN
jgi:hypothetical protein